MIWYACIFNIILMLHYILIHLLLSLLLTSLFLTLITPIFALFSRYLSSVYSHHLLHSLFILLLLMLSFLSWTCLLVMIYVRFIISYSLTIESRVLHFLITVHLIDFLLMSPVHFISF